MIDEIFKIAHKRYLFEDAFYSPILDGSGISPYETGILETIDLDFSQEAKGCGLGSFGDKQDICVTFGYGTSVSRYRR